MNKSLRFWDRIVSEFASRFHCWAQLCYFLAWGRRPILSLKRNALWLAIFNAKQSLRVPKGSGALILWQLAQEGGKVVSRRHRPTLPPPPRNIAGAHVCWRLSRPQGHSAAGRIMSMKNSSDTNGYQTCGLPTCSSVSQPAAPPCARYDIRNAIHHLLNITGKNLRF